MNNHSLNINYSLNVLKIMRCPNCNYLCSDKSLVKRYDMEYLEHAQYKWKEKHKCIKCNTEYVLDNNN